MARPKKIDTLDLAEYGIKIDIYLNKETGEFHAESNGARVSRTQLAELKRDLTKLVEDQNKLEWHPFIEIKFAGGRIPSRSDAASISLSTKRIFLSKMANEIVYADWWVIEELGIAKFRPGKNDRYYRWHGEFAPTRTSKDKSFDDEYTVLPYSEELWERLVEIEEGIKKLRDALKGLIAGGPEHILTAGIAGALTLPSTTLPESKELK